MVLVFMVVLLLLLLLLMMMMDAAESRTKTGSDLLVLDSFVREKTASFAFLRGTADGRKPAAVDR